MKFDNVLSDINGFGKFQIMIILIQSFSRMTLPMHFLLNNFIAAVPSHHCDLNNLDDGGVFRNLSQEQRVAVGVPVQDGIPSSCEMFTEPQYAFLSNGSNYTDVTQSLCQTGWVYDNTTFKSTIATEWDLVCSSKWMTRATATIFFIGVMCGAPMFGFLSDRYGRRRTLLVSYVSSLVFAVISSLSTSYIMFVIMRFFNGMALAGISIISIVLSVEWFGIEHRTFAGIIVSLDWTLGNWILVGFAYFVNEWRMLILAASSPLIVSIVAWWWLPESARWLLANGKVEPAHVYLMKCAKMNNRSKCMDTITPRALLDTECVARGDKKYTFLDLVRTPNMRKLAICSGIAWFGVACTYYGISLNQTGFGLNPYLTALVFATIEIPGKVFVYYFLNKFGRRPGLAGALLTTGACLFINLFVPKDRSVIRTIVAVLGKGLSEASFTIAFLYTTELFPTVVRQNGLGYTSFVARLGVSIAPLIALLDDVWLPLPAVVYCMTAVGSGIVATLLPETLNRRLPEVIDDIEQPRSQTNEKEWT